jgi:hypothetical protein
VSRAFGLIEAALLLALVAVATWGIGDTLLRRSTAPAWLQPVAAVWT